MPVAGEEAGSRRLNILFVEDDELIRMVTLDLMESLGHAVYDAPDAKRALAILETTPVDVLVTDLGLPDMPGSELAAEARRARPDLKVIYATGADRLPADGKLVEGALLLRKPYDAAALSEVLRQAGERRGRYKFTDH